jgi:CRP/FNR family transcriptional regulator
MPLKVVPRRDRKLYRLVKRGETLKLRRGETLYSEGDRSVHLFLIRAGHLRLYRWNDQEQRGRGPALRQVAAILGPWELAGEEALLPDAPRRLTALAGEPVEATVLEGREARRVLQTSQKTFEAFLRAKEEELTLARALARARSVGGAKARLGTLLLHLSARLGKPEDTGIPIPIPLSHQVLANLCAAHRSTVTTLLNDWIYDGVLKVEGRGYRILEPDALRVGEQREKPPVPLT